MTITPRPKIEFPGIIRGQKPRRLSHDFETYSDEDVTDISADAYSRHPSTEVLMCSFAFDNGPVKQWVPVEGQLLPPELEDGMLDERVIKTCWNKSFEWSIWKNTLGIETPHHVWRDTQALAYSLALPGSLEKAGEVVDLAEDKKKSAAGRALMRIFSSPRKPSKHKPWTRTHWHMEPAKWEEYKDYNILDTEAERAILRKLLRFDMPEHEWELWVIDQIINERGIPINMRAVDAAIRLYENIIATYSDEMKEITGLANPNSGAQLLPWLQDRGYPYDDLKKGHVERAKDAAEREIVATQPAPDPVVVDAHRVLELRVDTARASVKKYYAIERCVDRIAGVLRNQFQFAGAGRTWRWAGRTFQPQNLPRPPRQYKKIIEMVVEHLERLTVEEINLIYNDPMDFLVACIRAVAQAIPGFLLYDADLNAIENRVLGWMAKDRKILRVFEMGRDPYIDFATYMYHQPYDALLAEYKGGDDAKRTLAKPAVLGCGYGLGVGEEHVNKKTGEIEATGILGYARNMNVIMSPEQAARAVAVFRETYESVVEFWRLIEKAAKRCITTGRPVEINMIRFEMQAPFLEMILPAGRALRYCRPRIESVRTPWGAWRDQITYEGQNAQNQWVRISTHGGKLTENGDQAIARDIIAGGLRRAYYRGLDICLHVHDQIVGMAPEDEAEEHLRILQECMAEEEEWHIHGGVRLPLSSAGFTSRVFMKD